MRIAIVGGGSTGWIAAATLHARFNALQRDGPVALTVVESPDTPRIGVGEATIPTFRNVLQRCGIPEAAFLASCDATFKHAIRFDDWSGPGTTCWHPFHRDVSAGSRGQFALWLASSGAPAFAETISVQPALAEAGKAPKAQGTPDYQGAVPYAYHLDAEALAGCLADRLTAGGVVHARAHVAEVLRSPNGDVAALATRDGRRIEADLYIDCTGFRAILSQEGDWVDYGDRLLCDRAVTLRVPAPDNDPAAFTRARALSAGWAWDIGLRHRRGRGYVYSSRHVTDEAAEAELRAIEPAAWDIPARIVPFRSGRRVAPWRGNVVAMGLAAGFLEPLESTGLFLSDYAARALCEMMPPAPGVDPAPLARRYNALLAEMHDDLSDFIGLHYAVARRSDTAFWRDARAAARRSDRLRHLLQIWDLRPPSFADFSLRYAPFSHQAWEFILAGLGWTPAARAGAAPEPAPDRVAGERARLMRTLPGHLEALRLFDGTAG